MRPYADSVWPVRDDLADAYVATLEHWAAPGTWWTGEQRLALVAEARRARTTPNAPAWHAPSTLEAERLATLPVPPAAVDAVWRITRHPGSLIESWYESIVGPDVSPEQYVELVGSSPRPRASTRSRVRSGWTPLHPRLPSTVCRRAPAPTKRTGTATGSRSSTTADPT